jgi:opacity protein-like surface antigen
MKTKLFLLAALIICSANSAFAQKQEIAFTSGGLKIGEKGFNLPNPGFVKFKTGFTYEINYAHRLVDAKLAALYFETLLAGTPRTKVTASNALAPRSYSSLFVATGLKLKLIPGAKYSPFAMTGVGISRFNTSSTLTNDQANPNQDSSTDGVFYIGGGLDVRLISRLSLRGEVRDFYSEIPPLNINALRSRQHNALISAGLVINF